MSRRLGILAVVILALFGLIAVQAVNIQFIKAPSLDASPENPRNSTSTNTYPRGEILAADGSILAESVLSRRGSNVYTRIYPYGSLTSGIVGFDSSSYGTWALEAQYNQYLTAHAQAPQNLAQLLSPTSAADNVVTTIEPALQKVAQYALGKQTGAVVVLNPVTGAVLAMYSNPTYNPKPFESSNYNTQAAAWVKDTTNNAEGFPSLGNLAIQQTFPPGSTFKVVTTAAVVTSRPDLLVKSYPVLHRTPLPDTNLTLQNFGGEKCGGTIAVMLPVSCDTGYALIGLDLGGSVLSATANSFGWNETPPLDLPGVVASYFPSASELANDLPGLAYSAIGQKNVRATALQNALDAAAIGNGGRMMVPHILNYITSPDGSIIKRFLPTVWQQPLSAFQAGEITPLMVNVARYGTAAGLFPSNLDVAAKTGTAQVGNAAKNTDDWMITFAPANSPTIAVAVVLPFQPVYQEGATAAGPVMKCVVEGALALESGKPAYNTPTTCKI
jgi:peptidoglycan glycosyltransferase